MDDHKKQTAAVLAGIVLAVSLTVASATSRTRSSVATLPSTRRSPAGSSRTPRSISARCSRSPGIPATHPGYANLDMYWSDISVGRNGTWYPKHSFLISAAAAPFYALFGVPGSCCSTPCA